MRWRGGNRGRDDDDEHDLSDFWEAPMKSSLRNVSYEDFERAGKQLQLGRNRDQSLDVFLGRMSKSRDNLIDSMSICSGNFPLGL